MVGNVRELRPKAGDSEKITINLGYVDLGHIDLMVQEGFYQNRTDFIRTAIRKALPHFWCSSRQGDQGKAFRHLAFFDVMRCPDREPAAGDEPAQNSVPSQRHRGSRTASLAPKVRESPNLHPLDGRDRPQAARHRVLQAVAEITGGGKEQLQLVGHATEPVERVGIAGVLDEMVAQHVDGAGQILGPHQAVVQLAQQIGQHPRAGEHLAFRGHVLVSCVWRPAPPALLQGMQEDVPMPATVGKLSA
jgi:hypothetical protein